MKKVLIGGAFDLIHYGHISVLKEAKKYGDYLIVNITSDDRVRYQKGDTRPIIPEKERIAIVRELYDVDEVVCIQGDVSKPSHFEAVKKVKPDVLIVDCSENKDLSREEKVCKELGVRLVKMKRIITDSGLCTSKIIKKIKNIKT